MLEQSPINRPPTLTDAVVTHIRDAIVRGAYTPGQQLAEASFAVELVVRRHRALLDVRRAGEPSTAEQAVSEHISDVGGTIVAAMSGVAQAAAQPADELRAERSMAVPRRPQVTNNAS
jgi:DNA-binding GntR family transcriptional regulator